MFKESKALIAFREDILNRTFFDWLEAHISLMNPLHRYRGYIRMERETLSFYGTEKKTGNEFSFNIYRSEIRQLYHGFDEAFTAWETRNLGLGWKPLRITFTREKKDFHLYLIINYTYGRTDNEIWMEVLKNWLR